MAQSVLQQSMKRMVWCMSIPLRARWMLRIDAF
jgi:hypothetical protein